jgi:hypothetical protein
VTMRVDRKTQGVLLMTALLFLAVNPSLAFAQKRDLTDEDIKAAVQFGIKKKFHSPISGRGLGTGIGVLLHPRLWLVSNVYAYVFTPTEWIKWQAHTAANNLRLPYTPSADDLAPVLRVVVVSETSDLNYPCDQVSNVVLRDAKKATTVQPVQFAPMTQEFQNAFGAKVNCAGAIAVFSLDDLDKIRSLDANREFFVSIATDRAVVDRKVSKGDFDRLE